MYRHEPRATAALVSYAGNSRTHTDEQVRQIGGAIREFGFTNPILIDEENTIIAGHGRLAAAELVGMSEVPCIVLEGLSEAQKKAYVIADNQLALNAGWDEAMLSAQVADLSSGGFDLSLLGFDDATLEELLYEPQQGLSDDDAVPEPPEEALTQPGDVWTLGNHRLMCGDSANASDVDTLLDGKTIDLVFTDPPYGLSYAEKNALLNAADKGDRNQKPIENDHMTVEETGELWAKVFSLLSDRLSEYSSYYIASPGGGDLLLMMMMMMKENGLPLRHTIIWAKNNQVLGRCDYNYKHEPVLYGWNKRHKFYGKGEHKTSVWSIAKPEKSDLHPTMKPVELVENCILNSSAENQVVCDVFGGSGTTIIACEKTNRNGYLMEIDPLYCDVIIRRWHEYTGKVPVNEAGDEFPIGCAV